MYSVIWTEITLFSSVEASFEKKNTTQFNASMSSPLMDLSNTSPFAKVDRNFLLLTYRLTEFCETLRCCKGGKILINPMKIFINRSWPIKMGHFYMRLLLYIYLDGRTLQLTVISPPKHSEASWAESNGFTSASLKRYLENTKHHSGTKLIYKPIFFFT